MKKYPALGFMVSMTAIILLVALVLIIGNFVASKFGAIYGTLLDGVLFFIMFIVFFYIQSFSATDLVKRVQNYLSISSPSPLFNLIMECSTMGLDPDEIIAVMHQHGYDNGDLIMLIVELEKEKGDQK